MVGIIKATIILFDPGIINNCSDNNSEVKQKKYRTPLHILLNWV